MHHEVHSRTGVTERSEVSDFQEAAQTCLPLIKCTFLDLDQRHLRIMYCYPQTIYRIETEWCGRIYLLLKECSLWHRWN